MNFIKFPNVKYQMFVKCQMYVDAVTDACQPHCKYISRKKNILYMFLYIYFYYKSSQNDKLFPIAILLAIYRE